MGRLATEIIEYAKLLIVPVNRMLLNQISSRYRIYQQHNDFEDRRSSLHWQPNCATATCQVFDPTGGKINPRPNVIFVCFLICNDGRSGTPCPEDFPNVVIIDSLGTNPDLVLSLWLKTSSLCSF